MQPYLFPYIGYFHLINSVDEFVIYDDVQWMKGGWINRNRILGAEGPEYITLPIQKDSYKKNINERQFTELIDVAKEDILERMQEDYREAPYFEDTFSFVKKCFDNNERNASRFISSTIRDCSKHLGLKTDFIESSTLKIKEGLRAQERVIYINKILESDQYNNAIGGRELYNKSVFRENSIDLYFVEPQLEAYNQGRDNFYPGLSIIDVMMFNSPKKINKMLRDYQLV